MDVPGAITPEECMEELELDGIRGKAWHIRYVLIVICLHAQRALCNHSGFVVCIL